MRGLWVTEYTDFDRLSVADDIVLPPLAPKQLRLRVGAAGVSFATSLIVAGKYQRKPPLPFAPGTECAGEVLECGPEVTRFRPGDRICAALDWGAMAEEALAWEVNCYPIPDTIGFAEATNFNSYATSGAALTWPHLLNLQAGETLLVHGAAGGIGLAGVEIGKILGATVIATASTPEKRALATEHGADHVIDYTDGGFREAVNEITGGRGADAIQYRSGEEHHRLRPQYGRLLRLEPEGYPLRDGGPLTRADDPVLRLGSGGRHSPACLRDLPAGRFSRGDGDGTGAAFDRPRRSDAER